MTKNQQFYNREFYADIDEGSLLSAREIVPVILEMIPSRSVIDIGCGTGAWLSVFKENGVGDILGVDGDHVREDQLSIERSAFRAHDLTKPIGLERRFDLAMSVEVAEHLPAENADAFVDLLCSLSSAVLFSAAAPGQDGVRHVNEQWPDYWANKFAAKGFACFDLLRIRFWPNPNVESWYKQNLLIFLKTEEIGNYPSLTESYVKDLVPLSLVHPDFLMNQSAKLEGKLVRAALVADRFVRSLIGRNE